MATKTECAVTASGASVIHLEGRCLKFHNDAGIVSYTLQAQ